MKKRSCVLLKRDGKEYKLFSDDIKSVHILSPRKTPHLPTLDQETNDEMQSTEQPSI